MPLLSLSSQMNASSQIRKDHLCPSHCFLLPPTSSSYCSLYVRTLFLPASHATSHRSGSYTRNVASLAWVLLAVRVRVWVRFRQKHPIYNLIMHDRTADLLFCVSDIIVQRYSHLQHAARPQQPTNVDRSQMSEYPNLMRSRLQSEQSLNAAAF